MAGKLARVSWEMGQALLPEHFTAQEDALEAGAAVRSRLKGLPDYGIAALKVNDTLLSEGVFSITSMTAVMPSGLLLDVPGNAVITSFNLNVPGLSMVPVYLHVLKRKSQTGEDKKSEEDNEISRIIHQIVLSSEQSHANAFETMKIAQFEKNPDGIWVLSGSYIPPLLQVGTSMFLESELTELSGSLELFQYKLTQEIAASYLSGDSLTSAKQCLKSVYRIKRFLANILFKINIHPYYVYEALKDFYTEVCFYENTVPENITVPFDCDQLGKTFSEIFNPLKEQMQVVQAPSPYLPFELKDNVWQIKLPPRTREARDVYFLIQKKHVSETVSLKELKLAGLSRVSLVHKLALQGVPIQKIDRPPFQHTFGSEVDFFLISQGEEWDHALREMALGFYHTSHFEGMNYYLYWRFA
ncbi:Type IV secretion system protein, VasE-like [Desulfonema limicola]|uniref:Type IV secretion system protein, VasE-like n=1 Tax=Desulfonema limicola TaxID=45656 RepID=A0A975B9K5_9BACT|nr:type VI secretion system baseplate subunit TssK [Desulfonema limicola]QTA81201.1 Type IV secretion system protein, VasE-like [Desulfonema limicola]